MLNFIDSIYSWLIMNLKVRDINIVITNSGKHDTIICCADQNLSLFL